MALNLLGWNVVLNSDNAQGHSMSGIQLEDGWRVMIDPSGHPLCLLPPPPWIKEG
ncbi:MAG: hypothetical protein LBS21_01595 [Clostridiales bacterium]|jgi:hypothetical protein|nr:hypothetical protein [Clostridiales bacterium]